MKEGMGAPAEGAGTLNEGVGASSDRSGASPGFAGAPNGTAGTHAEGAGAPNGMTTDALAFMGDAVYETAIREMLLRKGIARADRLHREAVRYVSAGAQARVIRELFPQLTESEQAMVKRWRNHKFHSKAKHADPMTYKWATAFEALAGHLYLGGDPERLDWLLRRAIEIIEESRDVIR